MHTQKTQNLQHRGFVVFVYLISGPDSNLVFRHCQRLGTSESRSGLGWERQHQRYCLLQAGKLQLNVTYPNEMRSVYFTFPAEDRISLASFRGAKGDTLKDKHKDDTY